MTSARATIASIPKRYDVAVIGGGIVGLATADALLNRYPNLRLLLLEKETDVARHQTGHNSGVVHAGIYYRPGTLRARLCVAGVGVLRNFCQRHDVAYDPVGKVIVATDESEMPRLEALLERGHANGVPGLRLIDGDELRRIEPHAAGIAAIHSPHTAIVDYPGVCRALRARLEARGAVLRFAAAVTRLEEDEGGVTITSPAGSWRSDRLIACAGLHADRMARAAGATCDVQILPFRGEYYQLIPERRDLVRGLIYPVPDPALPFLGVHFTRMVDGGVEAGPNAVFALAREGYGWGRIDARDLAEAATYPGAWRLAARFWRVGAFEAYRSLSKAAFVRSLQKLLPDVTPRDVVRAGAGVRAQAVDRNGMLLDDFVTTRTPRSLHVLNAPSPAATASLAIGAHLAAGVAEWFG
jgi:(S)-2-hydroxyglutarate dehydrogenase